MTTATVKTGSGENAAQASAAANPANDLASIAVQQTPTVQRRRIPLSVPRRKLEVSPIPNFVLYWFLDRDIGAATDAGYEFVDRGEVKLNQQGVANDHDDSGNASLSSRVEVLGNKSNEHGKPEYLVLMKIRQEWWDEDHSLLDDHNAAIVNTIFSGMPLAGSPPVDSRDEGKTYLNRDLTKIEGSGRQFQQFNRHLGQQGALLNRGLKKAT